MSDVNTVDVNTVNGFTIGDMITTSDYGYTGTIRHFGTLPLTKDNKDWLKVQRKPWTDEDKINLVATVDVLPKGVVVVPISRLIASN